MSYAFVRLRFAGVEHELVPGDIIGRGWWAAMSIDDGRISEAHALVSLRGGELKLLPLRGRFCVDGRRLTDATLRPGLAIELARGLVLEVIEVGAPAFVLALCSEFLGRQTLMGVCSLPTATATRLVPGFDPAALAQFWNQDSDWRVRWNGAAACPLAPADTCEVAGVRFSAVAVSLSDAGPHATTLDAHTRGALRIVAHYDTVTLHRSDGRILHMGGIGARVLSELVAVDGPASWESLAREVWTGTYARATLRRKWDVTISRLRARLRQGGIPPEIVVADGLGNFELVVHSDDIVEDKT